MIYKNQPLRLEAVPAQGTSGLSTSVDPKFGYYSPGASTVAYFSPAVISTGDGIIYYDIPQNTLTTGRWRAWGWVDYGNGGIPGKPIDFNVSPEGAILVK